MTKTSKIGNGLTEPVKQVAVALVHPLSEGTFTVWGEGGIGPLMRRVQRELQERALQCEQLELQEQGLRPEQPELKDRPFNDFVTRAELAHLLDCYGDWPLPLELRCILILELRGERKKRPGPKTSWSLWSQNQDEKLTSYYQRGLIIGGRLRAFQEHRKNKQPRNAKPHDILMAREVACRYVRTRLGKFRNLTNASIANLVSQRLKQERIEREKSLNSN